MNQIPKVVFSRKAVLEPAAVATTRALEDLSRNREARGGGSASAVSLVVEEWARSRVAWGELAEEIARLERASGKEVLAHGGASFAQSLAQSGLVDEYRLRLVAVATPTTGPSPHLPLPTTSHQATMKRDLRLEYP